MTALHDTPKMVAPQMARCGLRKPGSTKFSLAILLLGLGAVSGAARAGSGAYERCQISIGKVFSCSGGPYSGPLVAVNPSSGRYENCKISIGKVFSCSGGPYSGPLVAVNPSSGRYENCKISIGKVFSCAGGPYSGPLTTVNL